MKSLIAAGALAAVAFTLIVALPVRDRVEAGSMPTGVASPDSALANPAVNRIFAVAAVRRLTALARRVDRIEAKYVRWGEYRRASGIAGNADLAGFGADSRVWVVAVSGDVVGQFSDGEAFNWGVYVFDGRTGQPVHSAANTSRAAWPVYFDSLVDQAR